MFSPDELSAILDLIAFHDDWDTASENVGVDLQKLYDKVSVMLEYTSQG